MAYADFWNIYESELPYSYPFQNASLSNEGHFANVARPVGTLAGIVRRNTDVSI